MIEDEKKNGRYKLAHHFKPGQSGNPKGKPKGATSSYSVADLTRAVKTVGKRKKKELITHFVERAYLNDKVLIALMKKIVPDSINYKVGEDPDNPISAIKVLFITQEQGRDADTTG